MNWMSITGLCLIVLGTIFSYFGTIRSSSKTETALTNKIQEKNQTIDEIQANNIKLIDQNSTLLNSTDNVSKSNKELIGQNIDMLDKISNYQKNIEEKNKKIEQLQKDITNIKDYAVVARLSEFGKEFANPNPNSGLIPIIEHSNLSDRMEKILTPAGLKSFEKSKKTPLEYIDELIADYPKFPFSYVLKYRILKGTSDSHWKKIAVQSLHMFEITTSINGHHPDHDSFLAIVREDLATNK